MGERIQPNDLSTSRDPHLQGLIAQNIQALGEQPLVRVVQALQRFNGPVTVQEKDGTQRVDNNWHLRQVLQELPGYAEASEHAGLAPDQAEGLLTHLLNSTPYDFERNEINVSLLKRSLNQEAELNQRLTKRDIGRLRRMITIAGKYGVLPHTIYGYTTARRIGLSIQDSTAMVMHLSDADGSLAGYTFGSFNEALSSLAIAQVDPEVVKDTFARVGGRRPYFRQGLYRALEEMITFGCPSNRTNPQEVLQGLLANLQEGEDIETAIERYLSEEQRKLPNENEVVIYELGEERDSYFIPKAGHLELAALPYRTQRGLNDGVRDLEEIARARSHRWESVGEGMWIFDPNGDTWYSLGGKTEVHPDRVRHNFIPYDASQLSEKPYMFHTHPEDLEVMLRNPYDDFPSREYRDHVTKFLSSTPSRADYSVVADTIERATSEIHPRSFIVHSLGITEFTYPNDLEKIKEMATKSRDIRDQAMLNFGWDYLHWRRDIIDEPTVARMLIDDLNKLLPEGFSIKLHEPGTNL
ncbi:MAG: hypothetical protein HYV37_03375 [Candidatus Levyibacteriota bacterium]|nr:MAG: hypothetical protein HYV37_03375 [Candidatus Levybacteria bacterium]